MIFLEVVAGVILLYLILSKIEQRFLSTTKYTVTSEKLGVEFDNVKLVVLADLHNHSYGKNNTRLIKKIEELSPDYILIAGDMIVKYKSSHPSNAFSLLEKLSERYQIYYAYGNHEQKMDHLAGQASREWDGQKQKERIEEREQRKQTDQRDQREQSDQRDQTDQREQTDQTEQIETYSTWIEYKRKLQELGVIFLDNQGVTLVRNHNKIRINGITLDKEYFEKFKTTMMENDYLDNLLHKKEDAFQLLIAHNPYYFHEYCDWGADLILSGHYHGGIVRLPFIGGMISPQVNFFPKYDSGSFQDKNHEMIVSRGLGSHSFMPRLFNPAELVFITLKHKY